MGDQRKKKKGYGSLLMIAGVLVLISFFFLAERLTQVEGTGPRAAIELTSAEGVRLSMDKKLSRLVQAGVGGDWNGFDRSDIVSGETADIGLELEASQDGQVWSSETSIDIFKTSYVNGENRITAAGADGEKIVAPGTSNACSFLVSNSSNAAMDYVMLVDASFSFDAGRIPLVARFYDHNGTYFVGSEESWAPMSELNQIQDMAVLGSDSYARYTLEWQWPFEGNDEYDTFLGDLTAEAGGVVTDGDMTMTVVIRTVATADEDPGASGGVSGGSSDHDSDGGKGNLSSGTVQNGSVPPEGETAGTTEGAYGQEEKEPEGIWDLLRLPRTGDSTSRALLMMLTLLSFAAFLILLVAKRRKKEEQDHGNA